MNPRHHFGGWFCIALILGFTACGVPGVPKPPSLNLPQPVTDLRAVRKGDGVYLAWTVPTRTTDALAIRRLGPTRICRTATPGTTGCANVVGEVAPPAISQGKQAASKNQGNYTDVLPQSILSTNPSAQVFYAVSVANENGRSAGLSNTVWVPALRSLPPPADFHAQVTADGVLLSWTGSPQSPDTPPPSRVYRVYRREEGKDTDTAVGDMPLGTLRTYLLLDHSFEWEKTYFYRMNVVTLTQTGGKSGSEFEGDDSPPVKVFAHDVFPPAVPAGLQAVFSGIGQQPFVDLIWAPDAEADLAGYNIYRREAVGAVSKINPGLTKTPAFRDTVVVSGHTYVYSVSAVDARGNESARSAEASEQVP